MQLADMLCKAPADAVPGATDAGGRWREEIASLRDGLAACSGLAALQSGGAASGAPRQEQQGASQTLAAGPSAEGLSGGIAGDEASAPPSSRLREGDALGAATAEVGGSPAGASFAAPPPRPPSVPAEADADGGEVRSYMREDLLRLRRSPMTERRNFKVMRGSCRFTSLCSNIAVRLCVPKHYLAGTVE